VATPAASFAPGQHTKYYDTHTANLQTAPLNVGFPTKTLMLSIDAVIQAMMYNKSTSNCTTTMKVRVSTSLGHPQVLVGLSVGNTKI